MLPKWTAKDFAINGRLNKYPFHHKIVLYFYDFAKKEGLYAM